MNKVKQRGFTVIELGIVVLIVVGFGGWVANVVKLAQMGFDSISGVFVLRAIGVFVAPLGSVLGFI